MQEFRWRVSDDYGPASLDDCVAQWEQILQTQRTWAVYRGGELGGVVNFATASPVTGVMHCMFAKRLWGHDVTVPALRAVADEIFATGIHKICCFPFADNSQFLFLMRTLGGEKEGVLRAQTMRRGEPTDMLAVGLLKSEFEARWKKAEAA